MVLLAGLVGIVAGLGAVAFQTLSRLVTHYGLGLVAGYSPKGPLHELEWCKDAAPLFGGFVPWLILAVITVGGLVSGLIVYLIAPEAEGHGTDAAIKAYHKDRGIIRARVPLVKIVASAITIGTGGSGGREGPIAQIGAGFGSFLATRLGLSERDRRLLLAAGLGAGIAAIFRAPLAGAIFAIEVLYREEDFEAEALIPAFISCTIAYCVFGLFAQYVVGESKGFWHLFDVGPLTFDQPALLGPLTGLAVIMALASFVYVRCFYGLRKLFSRLSIRPCFRPAIGAFATGVFAIIAYYALRGFGGEAQNDSLNVLSFGYGILQKLLNGTIGYGTTALLVVLLLVGFGKILTTSLTIGSGGSGGVFGPSMVIGGTLGAAVGIGFQHWAPGVAGPLPVYVILGMAAFFSAAAKTPVSTIIMVSELTGGYELLVPAMWVSALAYLLSRGWSIYSEQVPSRLDSPAHRGDFIVDVLEGATVRDIWTAVSNGSIVSTVTIDTPLTKIVELMPQTTQDVFPVVDAEGHYYGMFGLNDFRRFVFNPEVGRIAIAEDLAVTTLEPLRLDTGLSVAMGRFARTDYAELPIVGDDGRQFLGLLRRQEVVAAYNARLAERRTKP